MPQQWFGDPPGTWDYMSLIGSRDQPFMAVFEGDGTVNGPVNQYWNDFYIYDAGAGPGYSIALVENWEPGVDICRIIGGRIVAKKEFRGGFLAAALMDGPTHQAMEIIDRGVLNMKITVLSDACINGVRYHTRYPLCFGVVNVENGGLFDVQKLNVKLGVARGVSVSMSDRYPRSRGYTYKDYFYHDVRIDRSDYYEWVLQIN